MSRTASREVHRDDEYLASGTHDGQDLFLTDENGDVIEDEDGNPIGNDFEAILRSDDIDFQVSGVIAGLYIENTDTGESSLVATVKAHEITTDDDLRFAHGHTFEIYKTATKDSFISSIWTDISRGWKIEKYEDVNADGWRLEDVDIDDKGRKRVFGPGQPETR